MTRPRRPAAAKIVDLAALLRALGPERARGRSVVFTNGCFDILHAGHLRLLEAAALLGDLLVIGLNDDASVRRLKGPERPFLPFEDRARILAALEVVDRVVGFSEDTPAALIEALIPDILVKGGDWTPDRIVGREIVESHGGRVVTIPLVPERSTSDLARRIRERDPARDP